MGGVGKVVHADGALPGLKAGRRAAGRGGADAGSPSPAVLATPATPSPSPATARLGEWDTGVSGSESETRPG